MRRIFLVLALLALSTSARAQGGFTPEQVEWTSRVGRMLHGYHAALGVALSTVRERSGAGALPPLYAGGPYDDGWAFSFGALEGDSAFVIRYGVIVSGSGAVVKVDEFAQRRPASPHHAAAARALARVRDDFERTRAAQGFTAEAYRFAVLPFPRGGLTAFVSPAQTRPGVSLAGSDVMVSLGGDGRTIRNRIRFHHRLMGVPTELPPDALMPVLMVPDALGPSPVDVQLALERGAPLLVVAKRAYLIGPDGAIATPEDDPRVRAARERSGP